MPQAQTASVSTTDPEELIVRADARGHILFSSDSCRRLGYEPEDLTGQPGIAFVHPDDWAKFAANSASLYATTPTSTPADRRHRFRCADGSWRWLEGHPQVIKTHDGRLGDVVNVFRFVEG